MAKTAKVQITTPVGTAAYAWFHKPDTGHKFSNNKYKGDLVLDGDTDMSKYEATVRAFAKEAFPDADLSELHLPWASGDDHKNAEFHGKIILKASSKFAPTIVDSKRQKLPKKVQARSGDEVRYVCSLYAYEQTEKVKEGKKLIEVTVYGVSLQLQVVQLVAKNTGGGGLDQLDDIDGFDGSEVEDDEEVDDDSEDNDTSGGSDDF